MTYGHVYCITNTVNGKRYVGQTTLSLAHRWRVHKSCAKLGREQCPVLERAIRKYGPDAFKLELLETVASQGELDEKEIHWIALLGSQGRGGYNLRSGGMGGKHSVESKKRISDALHGRRKSVEHRLKIGDAQRGEKNHAFGKRLSVAHKKKCSEALRGENNPNYGKPLSSNCRAKISDALSGRKLSPEHVEKSSASNRGKKRSEKARARMQRAQQDWWASPGSVAAREKIRTAKLEYWARRREKIAEARVIEELHR